MFRKGIDNRYGVCHLRRNFLSQVSVAVCYYDDVRVFRFMILDKGRSMSMPTELRELAGRNSRSSRCFVLVLRSCVHHLYLKTLL